MRRDARPGAGRLVRRTATLTAAVLVVLAGLPGVARAGDRLVSAEPAPGAALNALPSTVTLRFAGQISGDDSHVAVADAGGDEVAGGEVQQPGPGQLRVPIRLSGPGDLTVAYHVIFLDGGSATGAYRFSAGTGAPPPPLSVTAQRAATASVSHHVHQVDGASAVLLVIDGAVLLVVVFLLLARRPNGRPGATSAWRYRSEDMP